MWYEDLTKCDHFGKEYAKTLTAVGWLESEKAFATGKVPKEFFEKLNELQKNLGRWPSFVDSTNAVSVNSKANPELKIYLFPTTTKFMFALS